MLELETKIKNLEKIISQKEMLPEDKQKLLVEIEELKKVLREKNKY